MVCIRRRLQSSKATNKPSFNHQKPHEPSSFATLQPSPDAYHYTTSKTNKIHHEPQTTNHKLLLTPAPKPRHLSRLQKPNPLQNSRPTVPSNQSRQYQLHRKTLISHSNEFFPNSRHNHQNPPSYELRSRTSYWKTVSSSKQRRTLNARIKHNSNQQPQRPFRPKPVQTTAKTTQTHPTQQQKPKTYIPSTNLHTETNSKI